MAAAQEEQHQAPDQPAAPEVAERQQHEAQARVKPGDAAAGKNE